RIPRARRHSPIAAIFRRAAVQSRRSTGSALRNRRLYSRRNRREHRVALESGRPEVCMSTNLIQELRAQAERAPEQPAFGVSGAPSWRELEQMRLFMASGLMFHAVRPADTVAICGAAGLEGFVAAAGALSCGAVVEWLPEVPARSSHRALVY